MIRSRNIIFIISVLFITLYFDLFSFNRFHKDFKGLELLKFISFLILIGMLLKTFLERKFSRRKKINWSKIDKSVMAFSVIILISIIIAYLVWNQTIYDSFKGYSSFYTVALYFIFVVNKIPETVLINIMKTIFFITLLVFLIDIITITDPPFSWKIMERRGGLTIIFFGQGFTVLGGLYYLNKFFTQKKFFFLLIYFLVCFLLIYYTRLRVYSAGIICSGVYMLILFSKKIITKIFIIISVLLFAGIVINSDLINEEIKDTSIEQSENINDDVRFLAQGYYYTTFQKSFLTYVFGNGIPSGKSELTVKTEKAKDNFNFYISDLGISGVFVYFGLLGALIWVYFFISVFNLQTHKSLLFVKAYFVFMFFSILTGYTLIDPGFVPSTFLALGILSINSKCYIIEN